MAIKKSSEDKTEATPADVNPSAASGEERTEANLRNDKPADTSKDVKPEDTATGIEPDKEGSEATVFDAPGVAKPKSVDAFAEKQEESDSESKSSELRRQDIAQIYNPGF